MSITKRSFQKTYLLFWNYFIFYFYFFVYAPEQISSLRTLIVIFQNNASNGNNNNPFGYLFE